MPSLARQCQNAVEFLNTLLLSENCRWSGEPLPYVEIGPRIHLHNIHPQLPPKNPEALAAGIGPSALGGGALSAWRPCIFTPARACSSPLPPPGMMS